MLLFPFVMHHFFSRPNYRVVLPKQGAGAPASVAGINPFLFQVAGGITAALMVAIAGQWVLGVSLWGLNASVDSLIPVATNAAGASSQAAFAAGALPFSSAVRLLAFFTVGTAAISIAGTALVHAHAKRIIRKGS